MTQSCADRRRNPAIEWLWRCCVLFVALGCMSMPPAYAADRTRSVERQVKAAYLYKFASYVDWPEAALPQPESPFVIAVLGADELADELEQAVAGHSIKGHPVTVRKLRHADPVHGAQMLFIGRQEIARLDELVATAKEQAILTVTDSEDAHARGSMVNFVVVDDKLRFEVALKPVALAGLRISALMLASAYKVAKATS